MPCLDGIAFLKEVRSRSGDFPFILFTGKGREEVVIEAINNGVDFYLQKGGDITSLFTELGHKIKIAVEQRKAASALRDSEQRLADIINFLPDATFARDSHGTVIAWNRAIEEMTGIPSGEMLGKGNHEYALPFYGQRRPLLIDLIQESEDELTRENFAIVKREGDVIIAETSAAQVRGQPKIFLCKASLLYDKSGKVTGAIESIRDITEAKRVEDELRLFRASVDQGHDEVFWLDFEGNILYVNDSACRVTGYTREELLAMKIFQLDPDIRPRRYHESVTDLRKQNTQLFTTRHRCKNGSIIDVEIMAAYITRGGREYSFAFVREITGRIEREAILRESEDKYRSLVESSFDGVIVHQDGKIVYANRTTERLAGQCRQQFGRWHGHHWVYPHGSPGACPAAGPGSRVRNAARRPRDLPAPRRDRH